MQGTALQATNHQFGHHGHRPGYPGHFGHPPHRPGHPGSAGDGHGGSTGGHSDDDGLDVGGIEDHLAAHHHRLFSGINFGHSMEKEMQTCFSIAYLDACKTTSFNFNVLQDEMLFKA